MSGLPPVTQGQEPLRLPGLDAAIQQVDRDPLDGGGLDAALSAYDKEADGFLARTGYQALGAIKGLGDATVNIGALAVKAGSAAVSGVSGNGFGQGWQDASQGFQEAYGNPNPGLADLFGPGATNGVAAGDQADRFLQEKLGRSAFLGETIGHLASFVTGPGALVGKAGAKAAQPLAKFAERAYLKTFAKIAEKATGKSGVWEQIAKLPRWQQTLAKYPAGYLRDTVSTTAGLMAQSYATAKDDDRVQSALVTAMLGPLMVPISQVGGQVGRWISQTGMTGEGATAITQATAKFDAGVIGAKELDSIIRENTKWMARVGGNNVVAPMFEGTLLMSADKNAWDLAKRMYSGDPNAAAELTDLWLATAGGLGVAKGLVPHNLAHLFATLRPDANTLRHHLEAQSNKAVEKPAGFDVAVDMSRPVAEQAAEAKPLWERWETARQEWMQSMDVEWAEVPADAAIKSGWTPQATGIGVLEMAFSPRFSVRMERGDVSRSQPSFVAKDPAGPIKLEVGPGERKALRDVGVDLPEGTLSDQSAQYALDSLTMLSTFRRLQGDVAFQTMGAREIEPGVFVDDATGMHMRMDLDGKILEREPIGGEWKVREDQTMVHGIDLSNAKFNSETEGMLAYLILQKRAMAPDPLVDSLLSYALAQSVDGQTIGAQQVREFLANTPFEQLVGQFRPGMDRELAMELGRLAMGTDNAQIALFQRSQKQAQAAATMPAGREGEQGSIPNVLEPVVEGVVKGAVAAKDVTGAVAGRIKDVVGQPQGEWLSEVLPGAEEPHVLRRADARSAEISSKHNEALREAKRVASEARYNEQTDMGEIVPEAKGLEMTISRGRALTDKRIKTETDAEKAWFESTQKAVRGVWEDVRQSGGFQVREGKVEPMRERDRGVISFEQGKDAKDVYENDTLRKQWFDDLVKVHPDKMVAETKPRMKDGQPVLDKNGDPVEDPVYEGKGKDRKVKMRRMTGEDLEKRYKKERKKLIEGKVAVEDADVAVATEFQREFVNTPDVWRGRRMLETNPLRAIDSMVRKQAAAAAINESIGPDMPSGHNRDAVIADLKKRLKETPDDADVQRLLDKLETTSGVEGLVSRVSKAAAERYPDTNRAQEIVRVTRDYAERIQKSEPVKLGPTRRMGRRYQQITSQAKTLASGVYDIGEMVFRPWMLGSFRDVLGVTKRLFGGNPLKAIPEAIRWAEDFGMMLRDSGDLSISETDSKIQKGLDIMSFPSMGLEKVKGVSIAHTVDRMAQRIEAGKATADDVSWLRDWLRMSPSDVAAIEGGKVPSSDVMAQIRRESMVEMANRTTPSEASRFAANPNTHVYLRFVKWATRRLWSTVKTGSSLVSAGKALKEAHRLKDADLIAKRASQMRAAMWRSTKVMLGFTASGVVSQALSAMLYELFRSFSPIEGVKNWWSSFSTSPWENTAKAAFLQMLGGPYATMADTILSGGDATASDVLRMGGLPGEAIKLGMDTAGMVEDTAANTRYEGFLAAMGRDFPKMAQMIVNLGIVPKQAYHVLAASMGAILGDDLSYDRDNSVLTKFRIENNLMGGGGSGDTPPAYSEDLRRLVKVLTEDLTPEEREQKVMGLLRKAMTLKDTDSIAASLDGMTPLSRLTPENLAKFREYADDAAVERIRERESNVKALAKVVRKMEGGAQSDWQEELDTVARNAQAGFGSHWDDLMSRALHESAARRVSGEGEGTQLRELAETMALFPDQMSELFKGRDQRPILRATSTSRRASMIYRELRQRMLDRVSESRSAKRREN